MRELNELSGQVIGAAIGVHRHLGVGYPERVYGAALAIQLEEQGLRFQREARVEARFKGRVVGHGVMDFLVADVLVVELKAVERILPVHRAQTLTYLRATGLGLGLLLNFQAVPLAVSRVIDLPREASP